MGKHRRFRGDDSESDFPSPEEILVWAQGQGLCVELEEIDEKEEASGIKCLGAFENCFEDKRDDHTWDSFVGQRALILLVLLVVGVATYAHAHVSTLGHLGVWHRISTTPIAAANNVEEPSYPTLRREKTPVIGVVSTHHRTGTVLFQSMGDMLTSELFIDYDRVSEPFQLSDHNATPTALFHRFWNSTGRLVVGMHGFDEICERGQNLDGQCLPYDHECWMDACVSKDPKPEEEDIPVIHVVRNPVEILISSYLYHQQDPPPEEWLYKPKPDALGDLDIGLQEKFNGVPYYKVLAQLPPELGILVELTVEKGGMYRMARNYRDMEKKSYAKNIHFEDIKRDFKSTMKSVLDHLRITHMYGVEKAMKLAMIFDLDNMSESKRKAYHVESHVTEGKHNKDDLRQLLYNNPAARNMLQELAKVMGYESAFPSLGKEEGSVSVSMNENGSESGEKAVEVDSRDVARTRRHLHL